MWAAAGNKLNVPAELTVGNIVPGVNPLFTVQGGGVQKLTTAEFTKFDGI